MKLILITTLCFATLFSQAQSIERQVIGSTGGTASGGTIIVTSTVGETAIATLSGSLTLTQGYQQESSQPVSVEEIIVKANFSLYPNPTTGNSKLEITTENVSTSARIELYSADGKLISSQAIKLVAGSKSTTELNLSKQTAGAYFVKIIDSQAKLSKILRIIKQ